MGKTLLFRLPLLLLALGSGKGAFGQGGWEEPALSPFYEKALSPGLTLGLGMGFGLNIQKLRIPGYLEDLSWANGGFWYTLRGGVSYRPRASLRLGLEGGYWFPDPRAILEKGSSPAKSYENEPAELVLGEWRLTVDWFIPFDMNPQMRGAVCLRGGYYGTYQSWRLQKEDLSWASLYQVPYLGLGLEFYDVDGWATIVQVAFSYFPVLTGGGSFQGQVYRIQNALGGYFYTRYEWQRALSDHLALSFGMDTGLPVTPKRREGSWGGVSLSSPPPGGFLYGQCVPPAFMAALGGLGGLSEENSII